MCSWSRSWPAEGPGGACCSCSLGLQLPAPSVFTLSGYRRRRPGKQPFLPLWALSVSAVGSAPVHLEIRSALRGAGEDTSGCTDLIQKQRLVPKGSFDDE